MSMGTSTCCICTKKTIPPKGTFQEQLTVVFFLKRFFKYSVLQDEDEETYLQSILQKDGNPVNWIWFCPSCYERVKKAQKAYALLSKLGSTLESARDGIERKVSDSFRLSPSSVLANDDDLFKMIRGSIYSHRKTSSNAEYLENTGISPEISVGAALKLKLVEGKKIDIDSSKKTLHNVGGTRSVNNTPLKSGTTSTNRNDVLATSFKMDASAGQSTQDSKNRKRPAYVMSSVPRPNLLTTNEHHIDKQGKKDDGNKVPEELRTCTVCFEVFDEPSLVTQHYLTKHAKASAAK